jgi:hypothetical protein
MRKWIVRFLYEGEPREMTHWYYDVAVDHFSALRSNDKVEDLHFFEVTIEEREILHTGLE